MELEEYFATQETVNKNGTMHYVILQSANTVQRKQPANNTVSSLYSLVRDFKKWLQIEGKEDFFFKDVHSGRKEIKNNDLKDLIVSLRKLNFSIEDILSIAQSKDYTISYGYVYKLLKDEGFASLPRRSAPEKKKLALPVMKAPVACRLKMKDENFIPKAVDCLLFCLLSASMVLIK
jgi:hypothetical protein